MYCRALIIMKFFTKPEIISLIVIFLVLAAVATPNFIISLEKARDQVRRDDMGALNHAFDQYLAEFNNALPAATPDGRIIDCLKPGAKPIKNKSGGWDYTPIPCEWGTDAFTNLITGEVYMQRLPQDPDYKKGVKYLYLTDGNRYQIYASMEAKDEAEIDPGIIARGLYCGTRICNIGRSYNVPINISIKAYDDLLQKQNGK
jgi:type II secretory pathway pseudopilin PulG